MFNPILPNHANDETIHEFLIHCGSEALWRQAGFTPPKIENPKDREIRLLVTHNMKDWGDGIMHRFCGHAIPDYNPCVPFLMTLWMWLSEEPHFKVPSYQTHFLEFLVDVMRILLDEHEIDVADNPPIRRNVTMSKALLSEVSLEYVRDLLRRPVNVALIQIPDTSRTKSILTLVRRQTYDWARLTDAEIYQQVASMALQLYERLWRSDV